MTQKEQLTVAYRNLVAVQSDLTTMLKMVTATIEQLTLSSAPSPAPATLTDTREVVLQKIAELLNGEEGTVDAKTLPFLRSLQSKWRGEYTEKQIDAVNRIYKATMRRQGSGL